MPKDRNWYAEGHDGSRVRYRSPSARKGLLAALGATRAEKQYVDDKEGKSWHTGYIVRGVWYTIYEAVPMRNPA
jgi:hypothetical protein